MFERFTDKAKAAVKQASAEARKLGHDFIGTEHQLLGLLAIGTGIAHEVLIAADVTYDAVAADVKRRIGVCVDGGALAAIGIDLEEIRRAVDDSFGEGALDRAMATKQGCGKQTFTPRAKKVMELALREALSLGHNYIGTEHLLLAVVREGNGVAAVVLRELAPGYDFRTAVVNRLRAGA